MAAVEVRCNPCNGTRCTCTVCHHSSRGLLRDNTVSRCTAHIVLGKVPALAVCRLCCCCCFSPHRGLCCCCCSRHLSTRRHTCLSNEMRTSQRGTAYSCRLYFGKCRLAFAFVPCGTLVHPVHEAPCLATSRAPSTPSLSPAADVPTPLCQRRGGFPASPLAEPPSKCRLLVAYGESDLL